jgi:hypothetical protein
MANYSVQVMGSPDDVGAVHALALIVGTGPRADTVGLRVTQLAATLASPQRLT